MPPSSNTVKRHYSFRKAGAAEAKLVFRTPLRFGGIGREVEKRKRRK
jgi:hypothetical protein